MLELFNVEHENRRSADRDLGGLAGHGGDPSLCNAARNELLALLAVLCDYCGRTICIRVVNSDEKFFSIKAE